MTTPDVLDDAELEEVLDAMEMFARHVSLPPENRGPGKWESWSCESEFAGRLAATIRALRTLSPPERS